VNLKRILFAAVTAGMLTVTGCAGNTPDNNHGNRTGENLGSDVNRSFNNGGTRSNSNGGTRSNYNNYRNGIYSTDRYGNDTWNSYSTPAPGVNNSTRSNTLGNQLKRVGKTTGRTANVTVKPSAGAR
jgi:hypothetical protein